MDESTDETMDQFSYDQLKLLSDMINKPNINPMMSDLQASTSRQINDEEPTTSQQINYYEQSNTECDDKEDDMEHSSEAENSNNENLNYDHASSASDYEADEEEHFEDKKNMKRKHTSSQSTVNLKKKIKKESSSDAETDVSSDGFSPQETWKFLEIDESLPLTTGVEKYYKSIYRGKKEIINVGDDVMFTSLEGSDRPYLGHVLKMWQGVPRNGRVERIVQVYWYFHAVEIKGCRVLEYPLGVFKSNKIDVNDIGTVSHKCNILSLHEFQAKMFGPDPEKYSKIDLTNIVGCSKFYSAGTYLNMKLKLGEGIRFKKKPKRKIRKKNC